MVEFNQLYRKPNKERPLTLEEYARYVYGKGLPKTALPKTKKILKSQGIPSWANNPYDIPSAETTDHIAVKNSIMERLSTESDEVKAEILVSAMITPYTKLGHQLFDTQVDMQLRQLCRSIES
mgnify:CR=1 FL=1